MHIPFTLGAVWHFGLAVRDPRASAKWFMRILGLRKEFEYEGGVGVGNENVLIVFSKGKPSPKTIGHIVLREPIAYGQRVKRFRVLGKLGIQETVLAKGTTIGNRRILRFPQTTVQTLTIVIEDARATATLLPIEAYGPG